MPRVAVPLVLAALWQVQAPPGAKAMFYNPAGVEEPARPRYLSDPVRLLRDIDRRTPIRHCGIHFWFETPGGEPLEQTSARTRGGRFALLLRASCNGFLTVWDLAGQGRELTTRTHGPWAGFSLGDATYRAPGAVEFTAPGDPARMAIVWARSQTEVPGDVAGVPERLKFFTTWKLDGQLWLTSGSDAATPGEIGNYVVNRTHAGVAVEIPVRFIASR